MTLTLSAAGILGVAYLWRERALVNVVYRRKLPYRRGFPGETLDLTLEIENRKLLPVSWLRAQDSWPRAIAPLDEQTLAPSHIPDQGFLTNLFSLRWFERARRRYQLKLRQRGIYAVGPARLTSGDLFGMYEREQEHGPQDVITVFPELLPLGELGFPPEDPLGELRSRRRLFDDPQRPVGIREYHPEDSMRKVHWPATARTGRLQVKVHQPTSGQVLMACLNVSTFERTWQGVDSAVLEHMVRFAASLITQGIEDGHRVGIMANGCIARSDQPFRIAPGRTPGHLALLLEALAGVNPVVTTQFERYLMREAPRIPFGATLVVLTSVLPVELQETLLVLKRHERRIVVISFAKQIPPSIPGIDILHRPFTAYAEDGRAV